MSRRSRRSRRQQPIRKRGEITILKSSLPALANKPVFCLIVPWMALGGADKCGLDLMAHYKRRGFRIVVISTREMTRRDSRREKEFLSLADDVFCADDVIETVRELQPVYTIVNNSHEAYDQS